MKEFQAEHSVGAGTAHRALGLLKTWGLVEASGAAGRRYLESTEQAEAPAETPASPTPAPPAARTDGTVLLDLRLICLGEEARRFTAKADPTDADQLHRLLVSAARRHGRDDDEIAI